VLGMFSRQPEPQGKGSYPIAVTLALFSAFLTIRYRTGSGWFYSVESGKEMYVIKPKPIF
jgi:hypothetical protein